VPAVAINRIDKIEDEQGPVARERKSLFPSTNEHALSRSNATALSEQRPIKT
jgi:hypothetical protein